MSGSKSAVVRLQQVKGWRSEREMSPCNQGNLLITSIDRKGKLKMTYGWMPRLYRHIPSDAVFIRDEIMKLNLDAQRAWIANASDQ